MDPAIGTDWFILWEGTPQQPRLRVRQQRRAIRTESRRLPVVRAAKQLDHGGHGSMFSFQPMHGSIIAQDQADIRADP